MSHLFDRLSDRLFSPLAGPNRRLYASLILDLHPLFFDQIHADVFPSRESVRQEIEERLAVLAVAWQAEADEDLPAALTEASPAARAYQRLLRAGWFEEETEGYRVRVTVPPAVGTLWAALMDVARPDRVFYGGMVLSIHNNVQKALEDPTGQALAFRQAAREARRFTQHLNTMIYGLKGLLDELAGLDDHRKVLGAFFDDFVDRFLVQDYKRLKTRNNPFRFRMQILAGVRRLEQDLDCKRALVAGFMAQTGEEDAEVAWDALNADIDRLRRIFEQLDGHLARVERYRNKVEQRVADTVRYLDRSQPGLATRIAALLRQVATATARLDDADQSLAVLPLADALPVCTGSLREPSRQRPTPEARPLKAATDDPAVRARQAAMRAYLDRRRIDPNRIARYLETQMAGSLSKSGAAMAVASVEEFIAFTHVRHLDHLPGAGRLRQRYRVEPLEEWIDNDWLRCPGFVVHRQGGHHAS